MFLTAVEIFIIAVGLAADAFAVSMCLGLTLKKFSAAKAACSSLFFGGFQALMPAVGWLLGSGFERCIADFDHWIAFALLTLIGGKMILDALKGEGEPYADNAFAAGRLLVLAVATSIDALAVGITFAFLGTDILLPVSVIGAVTFALSFVGVFIGSRFGERFKRFSETAGGAVLIAIGLKILLEHLGVLRF